MALDSFRKPDSLASGQEISLILEDQIVPYLVLGGRTPKFVSANVITCGLSTSHACLDTLLIISDCVRRMSAPMSTKLNVSKPKFSNFSSLPCALYLMLILSSSV